MRGERIEWCEGCMARAKGYLVPETKDARCVEFAHMRDNDRLDSYVLARGTEARLADGTVFRQQPMDGKRAVIWKPEHRLVAVIHTWDTWEGRSRVYHKHVMVSNRSAKRSDPKYLCQLPEHVELTGPGAAAHAAEDAPKVADLLARKELKARKKERARLLESEASAHGDQLAKLLESLGFESARCSTGWHMRGHGEHNTPGDFTVRLSLDDTARLIEALGGTVSRLAVEPPPLWRVWYGKDKSEDSDPLIIAGRNRAAVVAHMTAHYCHKRKPGDEPNEPLRAELLIIEEAGPDPVVAETDDEAKAS